MFLYIPQNNSVLFTRLTDFVSRNLMQFFAMNNRDFFFIS